MNRFDFISSLGVVCCFFLSSSNKFIKWELIRSETVSPCQITFIFNFPNAMRATHTHTPCTTKKESIVLNVNAIKVSSTFMESKLFTHTLNTFLPLLSFSFSFSVRSIHSILISPWDIHNFFFVVVVRRRRNGPTIVSYTPLWPHDSLEIHFISLSLSRGEYCTMTATPMTTTNAMNDL